MNEKILAVIPARKGSKGLPNKNRLDLGGIPLIEHTFKSASNSTIDGLVVTSDDEEILRLAKNYKFLTLKRNKELCTDTSSTIDVVLNVIQELKILKRFKHIILLQPTSPFRSSEDINAAIDHYLKNQLKSLISVKKIDNKCLKSFVIIEEKIKPINKVEYLFSARQNLPEVYSSDGCIYIFNIKSFLQTKSFYIEPCGKFESRPGAQLDIDTLEDLEKARTLFQ